MSACQCEDRPCCGCGSFDAIPAGDAINAPYDPDAYLYGADTAPEWDEEGDGEWPEG